jgi:hypothetical protein
MQEENAKSNSLQIQLMAQCEGDFGQREREDDH